MGYSVERRCFWIADLMVLLVLLALFVLMGCAHKPHSSSYYYAQKQIEHGEVDFHRTVRVEEYLNAFTQFGMEVEAGQSIKLQVDPFTSAQPDGVDGNFIQVGVRTRRATSDERRAPISLCMVLDVSGSMGEDNKAKDAFAALRNMVMELNDGDEFALILFAGNAETLIGSTLITPQSRASITEAIAKIGIGGGTDIEAGLMAGYKEMFNFRNPGSKRLVLLTDGKSTVGIFSPQAIAKAAGATFNPAFRISTIGLGLGVEQDILRRIADEGKGYYYFAESAKSLTKLLTQELRTMLVPVAENVKLAIELAPGVSVKHCYGVPDSMKNRPAMELEIGDMTADEWRILVFEIEGDPDAWNANPLQARLSFGAPGASGRGEQAVQAFLPRRGPADGKPAINPYVARNSVLLANALSLVKIGELSEESRYPEALAILDLQIGNNAAVSEYGDKEEMRNELEALKRVRAILAERNAAVMPEVAMRAPPPKDTKLVRALKKGAELALEALPGPWRTAAELLMILVE
jgi:Ca-activated chloride channel homolog